MNFKELVVTYSEIALKKNELHARVKFLENQSNELDKDQALVANDLKIFLPKNSSSRFVHIDDKTFHVWRSDYGTIFVHPIDIEVLP